MDSTLVVAVILPSSVAGLIGYLMKRSVDQLDRTVEKLDNKIDHLSAVVARVAVLEARLDALQRERS